MCFVTNNTSGKTHSLYHAINEKLAGALAPGVRGNAKFS